LPSIESKASECTEELFPKSPEVKESSFGTGFGEDLTELILYTKDGGPPLKEAGLVQERHQ